MPSDSYPIKIFCKLHGLSSIESKNDAKNLLKSKDDKLILTSSGKESSFSFDKVFDSLDTTENVFSAVGEPLVKATFDGFNTCLINFGVSGAGKSGAVSANHNNTISDLTKEGCKALFRMLKNSKQNKECLITVSFLEIQDDNLLDLLNPHDREMNIINHPRFGIFVSGISEFVVNDLNELINLFNQGSLARQHGSNNSSTQKKSTSAFCVNVHQKSAKQPMGVKGRFQIIDLASIETGMLKGPEFCKGMSTLLNLLEKSTSKTGLATLYNESKLTLYLKDAIGGNCVSYILASASASGKNIQDTMFCMKSVQFAKNITNKVQVNLDEGEFVVGELREEISRLRDKVVDKIPSREDVNKLEILLADLKYAKNQSWEEKIKMTSVYEQERRSNLNNKGLTQVVLNDMKMSTSEIDDRLVLLDKEKNQLNIDFQEQKAKIEKIKEEVQLKIKEYSSIAETGSITASEMQQKISIINELKEKLRKESEVGQSLKLQLLEVAERESKVKESALSEGLFQLGNLDLYQKSATEKRLRQQEDHKSLLTDEVERARIDIDQERAEIQLRKIKGHSYSEEETVQMAMKCAEQNAEKRVIALQVQLLQKERLMLENHLEEAFQHQRTEIRKLQAANFQTFKDYRECFDRHKFEMEQRFRALLDDAIKDALFLSSRNNELMLENKGLKNDIAHLKDKLTEVASSGAKERKVPI